VLPDFFVLSKALPPRRRSDVELPLSEPDLFEEKPEEAEALVARSGKRRWCAELHRFRAVFLAVMGADEANIQASLCAAP
jgi:hypothetical protein